MTQEDQPQDLRDIFEKMKDPEFWGGVDHEREPITNRHTWAKLDLAHDAYHLAQIAEIVDRLRPAFSKRTILSPRNPDLLVGYLAKLRSSYVLIDDETVYIVGPNEEIDKIGSSIILNAKALKHPQVQPPPNTDGPISWRRINFTYDTIIPGDLVPEFERLGTEFGIDTLKPLTSERYGFMARIGEDNYLKALMQTIDIVGNTQDVNRITGVLTENHQDVIDVIDNFCDTEYVLD